MAAAIPFAAPLLGAVAGPLLGNLFGSRQSSSSAQPGTLQAPPPLPPPPEAAKVDIGRDTEADSRRRTALGTRRLQVPLTANRKSGLGIS